MPTTNTPKTTDQPPGIKPGSNGLFVGELVPNPANNQTSVSLKSRNEINYASVSIFETASGRLVNSMNFEGNSELMTISTKELKTGMYNLKVEIDGKYTFFRKLVIIK